MFASATWKNLSFCLGWDNCSPANLKGWNVRPFRSDRSVLVWSSLLQDEEGWYCQRVYCIIYLYQHPQYTWSYCWTSRVCWISKSAKGVYCQVRMPSDPCKWQWETFVAGYWEMVVYPQEGSQSCKLRWSSEYKGEVNLARAPLCEGFFFECLIGIMKRRSTEAFWPIQSWKISWLTKRAVWTIDHFIIRERNLSSRCLPQITY